ncbi:MAG: Heat-inducible transcription repressor hrcA [Thermoanaerobacterales bacterium 50_218]|nr:MAG: Heat-inducible transcription repressor hrcA [Thermoanaerobacterales bacterium 50_218]HAA89619.1 heat-inducible transcription repressor HrcA [Peptococcaceae bacterium]
MKLSKRKQQILEAIVEVHIATAEPVGSRTIARKYKLGVSPATIRNEMADLEEMGLIEQPHTSAGRIPSQQGYRYYVDQLMQKGSLTEKEENLIKAVFARQVRELATLIQDTIKLVTQLTDYLVFLSGPQLENATFHQIRFLQLAPQKALLVVMAESGWVESKVVDLPVPVTPEELEQITQVFNSYFRGLTFSQITRTMLRGVYDELTRKRQLIDLTLEIIETLLTKESAEGLYLGGARNILKQPEYRDIRRVRELLDLIEGEEVLKSLLMETQPTGINVRIGKENKFQEVEDCSVVTAVYTFGGNVVGAVGLLGPMRMDYARAIAVIEYITHALSEVLTRSRLL